METNIIEQDTIKEEKKDEENKEHIISVNNLVIIEEEEHEEDNKLRSKGKFVNKEKKRQNMIEYINSLPQKETYNIHYKIKTEKIPKKKIKK